MTETDWLASEDPAAMLAFYTGGGGTPLSEDDGPSARKLRLFACACVRQVWRFLTNGQRAQVLFAESEPWSQPSNPTPHPEFLSQDAMTNYCMTLQQSYVIRYAISWLASPNADEVAQQAPAWLQRLMPFSTQAAFLREIVGNPFRPVTLPQVESRIQCDACGKVNPTVTFSDMRHIRCGGIARVIPAYYPWLTPAVLSLAQAAYEERFGDGTIDPHRLAVLSDALEESGCEGDRCDRCEGDGVLCDAGGAGRMTTMNRREAASAIRYSDWRACYRCDGVGRLPHPLLAHLRSPGPHVRGCWALDLVLGKS